MGGHLTAVVVVLADDLMWSTRISEAVRRAGATVVHLSTEPELALAIEAHALGDQPSLHGAVVDLAARRFDGVAAVGTVRAAGLPVVAVAQHDDQLTRKRALAAGAIRVFSYGKFFSDGTALVERWMTADEPAGDDMGNAMGTEGFAERLERVRAALAQDEAGALLVGVGPELEWLTGYAAVGHERLNLLVISETGAATFFGPRLELGAARAAAGLGSGTVELQTWEETEDPFSRVPALVGGAVSRRLLVSDGLRAAFVLGSQAVLPEASWGLASSVLAPLRRVKDAEEVALLRAAAEAADRVIEAVVAGPLIGRSEAEVAREVRDRLVDEGHDTAEFAIVASGPNSASPHHEPGARRIGAGEPLLLDIGGRRAGYCSDVTRTVWIMGEDGSGPDSGFCEIYELTANAQAAARAAVRPGVTFSALDAVARDLIGAGGHGNHFIHRLGHGIGLEVHEEPYVVAGNQEVCRAGNAFSCEPGIYLEDRYGVRIEDVVVCTAHGGESLNGGPRELRVVSGH